MLENPEKGGVAARASESLAAAKRKSKGERRKLAQYSQITPMAHDVLGIAHDASTITYDASTITNRTIQQGVAQLMFHICG